MTPAHLTRQQRRAMQREANAVGDASEADRRFFERFPHRTFRVRSASRAEMATLEIATEGELIPLDSDTAAFTVVKNIAPGVRLRIQVRGPADEAGSDASEEVGAWLWERCVSRFPSIAAREAMLRTAASLPGGPLSASNERDGA